MRFNYIFGTCDNDCDECTVSKCEHDDLEFEYDVDFEKLRNAVTEISADIWSLQKCGLAGMINEIDGLVMELAYYLKDDLQEYFENEAFISFKNMHDGISLCN